MNTLLNASYKGGKYGKYPMYTLFSTDMDNKFVYGIIRNYGTDDPDTGLPMVKVTMVCEADGTAESYNKAYELFRLMADI